MQHCGGVERSALQADSDGIPGSSETGLLANSVQREGSDSSPIPRSELYCRGGIDTKNKKQKGRAVAVLFDGFNNHKDCLARYERALKEDGYDTVINASPTEYRGEGSCCENVDAWWMKRNDYHLGLGSLKGQAKATVERLVAQDEIKIDDRIVLGGHSQGAPIAALVATLLKEKGYKVECFFSIAGALKGAKMIESMHSCAIMCQAYNHRPSCCTACLCCILPTCIMPMFQLFGYGCCRGLTDLTPGSRVLTEVENWFKREGKSLPTLNIVTYAPASELFRGLPFGAEGIKCIVGGGNNEDGTPKQSDNVLASDDQHFGDEKSTGKKNNIKHCKADHGMFDVQATDGNRVPRIFGHSEAIKCVVDFCKQHCSSLPKQQ